MKRLIGSLFLLLSLAFALIVGLKIRGIEMVSLNHLLRGAWSLGVIGGLLVVLILCYGFFFRDPRKGYDVSKGNRAHPKL